MPGVYISWPFCAQKCTYCNFASGVYGETQRRQYLDALLAEIRATPWFWTPETVYLGGGTPSLMTEAELRAVLSAIPGYPWRECTMEAAPGTLSPHLVRAWASLGINRVSFGVQSFVQKELRQTGRKHNAETVEAECAMLRQHGIPNFNIDLIAGLPHQTPASWAESLDWIRRIAPPHVSVYMLEVDEDSRLGLEIIGEGGRYGAGAVPDDQIITDLYLTAVESLRGLGTPRYEISNFARPGEESLHNLKYWKLQPYRGFGVDAHSCDALSAEDNRSGAFHRWGNEDDLAAYLQKVEAGDSPATERTPLRPLEEHFLVGLRLDQGVAFEESDLPPSLQQRIHLRIAQGMLTREQGRLKFTEQGRLLSNEVFEDFLGVDALPVESTLPALPAL